MNTANRLLSLAGSAALTLTLFACDLDDKDIGETGAAEVGDGDGDGDANPGDGDGDGEPADCSQQFETCDDLVPAFAAETLAIRSCSDASECGQVLYGTSCGCTQDWVARIDADTSCFDDLVSQSGPLECDLGFSSDCSCPDTDGFACVDGICTWNYL